MTVETTTVSKFNGMEFKSPAAKREITKTIKLPAGASDHSHETDLTIATIVAPSGLRAEEAGAAEGEAKA